jgi:hypothetical protein
VFKIKEEKFIAFSLIKELISFFKTLVKRHKLFIGILLPYYLIS